MNENPDAQQASFSRTNVAPQYSNFNQGAWNDLECIVRTFMERELNGKEVFIITGTYGTAMTMNKYDSYKSKIRIPSHFWKAFCYSDEKQTYSWVYMQPNQPTEKAMHSHNFMSAQKFSQIYWNGASIFDGICQKPKNGFGPWFAIMQ